MLGNTEYVRNMHAGDLLETFLVSSVCSLLAVRVYLTITGFPQVGGGGIHIAHMLWGGLLMMIAIVLLVAFLGNRILWAGAIVGGIGFGIFIDELGKFITHDNNYLFQPTVAILYIIFLFLFFAFRYIDEHNKFTQKEHLMNALRVLEEAVLNDMDKAEKRHFAALLRRADQNDEITIQLKNLLNDIDAIPTPPSRMRKIYRLFSGYYRKITELSAFPVGIIIFFVVKTISDIVTVSYFFITYFSDPATLLSSTPTSLIIVTWGQILSTIAATICVIIGVISLKFSRHKAYFFFKQSLLITIFLTQFFLFYLEEFHALTGLVTNVLLLIGIDYMMDEEKKMRLSEKTD